MSTKSLVKSSCLSLVLALISILGYAQPDANFTASPVSGCAPLVVNFTDQSTGNPTQWRWDLGNGTISFLQNPSVTYFNPGLYTIKLTVQNASGTDSLIRVNYITINAAPTVNFTGTPLTGCFPLPIQFTDLSIPGSGTISNWLWDFGDGNSSVLQNPAHTYTASGNYNVSLKVTNSNGCIKTITRLQYVTIGNGVNADFSNTLPNTCTPPVNINFINLSTGTGALSYSWNFGDGNTSNLQNPFHSYTTPGSYTVQLIVTNSTGCSDTIIRTNAITIGTVNAIFSAPDSVCINTPFNFTNTSLPVPVSSIWNFGDGTTSTIANPVKSYSSTGTFLVKLISNFGACIDSFIKPIIVLPKSASAFTATPLSACQAPLTVTFNNTSLNAVSYQWNFGDGNTSLNANPVHTYTTPGTYDVTLISTNIFGCNDTIVRPQYISVALPEATINNLPAEGCAPLSVPFTSTVITNDPVVSYLWNFGDGNTSTQANPVHVFAAGTYDIRLIIVTASGCTDTVLMTAGVRVGVKPVAAFNANPRNVCAMVPVQFNDLSTGTIDQWHWDFGDGGTSNAQNPMHVYEDTGYFDVQLIVINNGCRDTLRLVNYVHIDPPVAIYSFTLNCDEPAKRVFTDLSIGADTWMWDFGDGNTSSLQNPVHVYATPGSYTISLTVTNNISGCSYTRTQQTLVVIENADFTSTDTSICRNTQTSFSASGITNNVVSAEWLFGDGATGTGFTANHIYTTSGTYTVSLIITDVNGCRDTIVKPDYIIVNGPVSNFGVLSAGTCSMNSVPLSDSSTTDGTHPINSWIWNYGDGLSDTLTAGPFQHSYAAPGIYTISLKVTDTEGCTDSIVKFSILTISQPAADFVSADTLSCPGMPVSFTNLSTGPALNYSWDFGDAATSTSANPVHMYANDGTYTVKLMISDQFGCTDTIIKNNYIHISTPHANFNVSDTLGTCPPLVVNFTNTSDNFTSFAWDFGDGTSSQAANPSHFYSTPGNYIATLTVNAPGGCTSVKTQTIVVRGPQGSFTYGGLSGCDSLTVNFVATTRDRLSFIWDFNDGTTVSTTDSVISHTYSILGIYVPKMILLDAAGCVVPITGPDTIRINGASAGFTFNSQTLCNSGSVQFTNTTSSSDLISGYSWNFGDGTSSTDANPLHFYSGSGIYYPTLTVTTINGCIDSVTNIAPVRIVSSPQAQITQTNNGCVPLTVSFNGSLSVPDTSALTWNWNFGNGHTSTLQNPAAELYATTGNYPVTLYLTNSSGCMDTVISQVEAFGIPVVSAGTDLLVCQGTGNSIHATGASTYVWSAAPGLSCYDCADPVASPDSLTTYYVTGTSSQGCSNIDSVIVTVKHPFSIVNSGPDTLCTGSSVRLQASGAYSYSWSPSAGLSSTTSANPTASPAITTTYQVIGTDENGCFKDTAYVPVRVYPIPAVEAGEDKTINVGQIIDLIPVISADVTNVVWSPTGSIFRSQYPGITVKPKETTTYQVVVTNPGGCRAVDNLTVYVICNGANVFIPNTFSPNNDGSNDVFFPRGTGVFTIKTARVYNRWGEVVYERNNFQANDQSAGWDGTFKGVKLNPDVYVYIIDVLCDNNTTLPFKGNVALIK